MSYVPGGSIDGWQEELANAGTQYDGHVTHGSLAAQVEVVLRLLRAARPSPEEFVRMVHDSRCPIDQVGIYPWETQNGNRTTARTEEKESETCSCAELRAKGDFRACQPCAKAHKPAPCCGGVGCNVCEPRGPY